MEARTSVTTVSTCCVLVFVAGRGVGATGTGAGLGFLATAAGSWLGGTDWFSIFSAVCSILVSRATVFCTSGS